QVPVTLFGIKLHGEAAHIASSIHRAALARNRRKARKNRRAFTGFGEGRSHGVLVERLVALKIAVGSGAASVDDTLWNSFVIKVRELFPQNKIFHQTGAAQARFQ